jgi:hypothetical protein
VSPASEADLRRLKADLGDARRDLKRAEVRNEQLVASNRDLSSLLSASSRVSGDLLRTIVALRRLLEAEDRAAALRSLEEILVNIIGTEDFVVLAKTDAPEMRAVAGMGPALDRARATPLTLAEIPSAGARTVPMNIAERVVGAIVIDRLLPHRGELDGADEQVLALLSSFAASAVMMAGQRKEWTRLSLAEVA